MDLFSEALALADTTDGAAPVTATAAQLVTIAGGSVERLLDAEHRARALERTLPNDPRARRLHELVRYAARLAMRTPCDEHPSALSDRLADVTGSAETHVVDADQLAADLERLRASA